MKNRSLIKRVLIVCTLAVCTSLFPLAAKGNNADILKIRKWFQVINKEQNTYGVRKQDLRGFSTEGGSLTVYLKNREIKKIEETHYGESGARVIEYYFNNNELFFIYDVVKQYTMKKNPKSGEWFVDTEHYKKTENRYYFNNRKMIRWIDRNKKTVTAMSARFKKKEKELLTSSLQVVKWAQSKKTIVKE